MLNLKNIVTESKQESLELKASIETSKTQLEKASLNDTKRNVVDNN